MKKATSFQVMEAGQRVSQARREKVKRVEYPEWDVDGSPLVCFIRPLTLAEQDQIVAAGERAEAMGESGNKARIVETILVRARHEDGTRIFQDPQRPQFNDLDSDLCVGLYTKIRTADRTVEEVEEDFSDPGPGSGSE